MGYLCANFGLPRPLCSRVTPDVRDRQTDRQKRRLNNAPAYQGRGRIVADAVLVQLLGTGRLVLVIEPQVDYWYIVRVLEPKYSLARGLFVSTVFRGINA